MDGGADRATGRPSRPSRGRPVHRTPEERQARGKAARQQAPRSSHGRWVPAADRPDPVALLEEQARSRDQDLVPIRYGRMLVSPFTFYRGAALVMAADLAGTARSGLTAQLCGDAHLSNFGMFASPERRLVFDINDFDETLPGPWEWDVKRLAASLEIAGRDRGFRPADRRAVVVAGAREYRERMQQAAEMRTLDVWYTTFSVDRLVELVRAEVDAGVVAARGAKRVEQTVVKSRTRDSVQAFAKFTSAADGVPRIRSEPPLIVPIEDLAAPEATRDELEVLLRSLLQSYRKTLQSDRRHLLDEFRYVHTARKVVGVGSVGTRAWILLLLGRDGQDPLFLQAKEAQPSVLERFVGASAYRNCAERVVAGQRLMQAASDILLGWQRVTGLDGQLRDYYVRQLRDWKGSVDVDRMLLPGLTLYARLCGATLARAHARSGDRIAIAAYLGRGDVFDRAVADFSAAYADQNEQDYAALVAAVQSGRVQAQTGL